MPAPRYIFMTVRRATSAIALSLLAAIIYPRPAIAVLDHPGRPQHFAPRDDERASPVILPGLRRGDFPADADCHACRRLPVAGRPHRPQARRDVRDGADGVDRGLAAGRFRLLRRRALQGAPEGLRRPADDPAHLRVPQAVRAEGLIASLFRSAGLRTAHG